MTARLQSRRARRGMTLIEMMVVVVIIAIIAGVSFPAVTSGIDSLRLRQASEEVVGLFNTALDLADRRQQPVEVIIDRTTNQIAMAGALRLERVVELPPGVRIVSIAPPPPMGELPVRRFLLMPSGAAPQVALLLANARGALRVVSVDPITGIAQMATPAPNGALLP